MNSFTDTEIDTLELPKIEEKPKQENIVQPDEQNIVKLVGNKNIVSALQSGGGKLSGILKTLSERES